MSTVAGLETALEELPTEQILMVAPWLDERRVMLIAGEAMLQQLDESRTCQAMARRVTCE